MANETTLTDDAIHNLIVDFEIECDCGIETYPVDNIIPFARAIEQAVLAKLAEQVPVAYAAFSNNGNIRLWSTLPQIGDGEVDLYPLYAHPMPNCQVNLDSSNHIADVRKKVTPLAKRKIQSKIDEGEYRYLKGATVLVNEHGRAAIVNHGGAFYWVENADMYVEFHRAETQFDPDHIADASKMVPEGWQLVPDQLNNEMAQAMRLGSRKDCPGDLLCEVRYTALLAAAPKYTGDKE